MSNVNKTPWYKKPIIVIPAVAVILAAIVGVYFTFWLNPPPSDFRITINPMQGAVHQGGVIQTTVTIKGIHGYENSVSLSASDQPSGVVVAFTPPFGGATPAYTSNVMITVGTNVPADDYIIIIKGTGADGKEHSSKYSLTVKPITVTPTTSTTPTVTTTTTRTPTPTVIDVNPAAFKIQGDEFLFDSRYNVISGLPIKDGVNLSNYDLEFAFQGGGGRQVQLWYKDSKGGNVYSFPYTIKSGQSIRYNPLTDGRNVDEFDDFTHIYAIGAKIWGGVEGIQITSVKLIKRD